MCKVIDGRFYLSRRLYWPALLRWQVHCLSVPENYNEANFLIKTFDVRRVYANGMFDLKLKGLLSSQVLQKCVQLPANTARSGDSRNILSAEVNQVVGAMPAIHTLWLAPAELAMTLVVFCFYNGLLTLCLVPLLLGMPPDFLTLKYKRNGMR